MEHFPPNLLDGVSLKLDGYSDVVPQPVQRQGRWVGPQPTGEDLKEAWGLPTAPEARSVISTVAESDFFRAEVDSKLAMPWHQALAGQKTNVA